MSTSLEDRLTAALSARAEQVTPESLRADVPATVSPLRRRTVTGAAILGAAAAVAAVVGIGVAVTGDAEGPGPAGTPSATDRPTPPTPPTPPSQGESGSLSDLLPESDVAVEPVPQGGLDARIAGARVELSPQGLMVVHEQGLMFEAQLRNVTAPLSLRMEVLPLGQAGSGYVVIEEGKPGWRLIVPVNGGLAQAAVPDDVPFGTGFTADDAGYLTWTNDTGTLFTRVQVGDPSRERYRVYRWEVTGPGEGGGPDVATRSLVPTDLGVVCFDFVANSAERC